MVAAVVNMVVGEEIAAVVGVENMGFVEMVALVGNMVIIVVGDTVVVEVLVEVLVENMAVGVAQVGDKVGDKVEVECKDPEPEVQGIVVGSIVKVDKVGELVEHWRIID
jgi:hypothetical protein